MAFRFKKQIFGFMDLIRFTKMVDKRRSKLDNASAAPLPVTYRVNETAKILHPSPLDVKLVEVVQNNSDTKTFTFQLPQKAFFRAGQYAVLRAKIGESLVSRPYAISSSPYTALNEGKVCITIKKSGYFSSYMFDSAKEGDDFTISLPFGNFFYESLKDCPHIVGIAGGSGITPFYSMIQAIEEGSEDFKLTLFYGAKTSKDLVFKEELDKVKNDKIKIVYVLSDEKSAEYENGFISADIIKKYVDGDFTAMLCGPNAMYNFVDAELAKMGISGKFVKHEANCTASRDVKPQKFNLTVHIQDCVYNIEADSCDTLLTSMEKAGLSVPARCRAGGCGFCHSKLVKGKFSIAGADKRRLADSKFGYIHPCCSYPDSDIELIVPRG